MCPRESPVPGLARDIHINVQAVGGKRNREMNKASEGHWARRPCVQKQAHTAMYAQAVWSKHKREADNISQTTERPRSDVHREMAVCVQAVGAKRRREAHEEGQPLSTLLFRGIQRHTETVACRLWGARKRETDGQQAILSMQAQKYTRFMTCACGLWGANAPREGQRSSVRPLSMSPSLRPHWHEKYHTC